MVADESFGGDGGVKSGLEEEEVFEAVRECLRALRPVGASKTDCLRRGRVLCDSENNEDDIEGDEDDDEEDEEVVMNWEEPMSEEVVEVVKPKDEDGSGGAIIREEDEEA